jgi:hypothetical protein
LQQLPNASVISLGIGCHDGHWCRHLQSDSMQAIALLRLLVLVVLVPLLLLLLVVVLLVVLLLLLSSQCVRPCATALLLHLNACDALCVRPQ